MKYYAKLIKPYKDAWWSTGNGDELKVGQMYKIEQLVIEDCHTEVYLKDVKGYFNSIFFKFYDETGKKYDILDFMGLPIAICDYC